MLLLVRIEAMYILSLVCKKLYIRALKKHMKKETQQHLYNLKEIVKAGDTVYTVLQSVSSNGMSRRIKVIINDGERVRDISYLVAKALEYRYNSKYESLVVGGCGMDMGHHVVYSLASALGYTTNGAQLGDNCYGLNHKWI